MKHTARPGIPMRVVLIALFVILSLFSLSIGVKDFSLLGLLKGNEQDIYITIISRLPRLMSSIIAGASLSIAGLIMQTITNNKFVSPSTAGTMEWCRFGIMLSILIVGNQSKMSKMLLAFIISLAGTFLFLQILQKIPLKSPIMVPLIGMMLGNVVSSITGFIAYQFDIIQNISSWLQGSFSLVVKGRYELLYLGIPVLFIAYLYAGKFTIAGMGKDFATNLGLNHKWVVMVGLTIVSFITTLVVITVGSIPFIGLIVPNIVALYKGDNLKHTLLDTVLIGTIFVLFCDILGRVILYPYEVSISIVISILGSIVFLFVLFKRRTAL
jgi:iron complex transport system permease protein